MVQAITYPQEELKEEKEWELSTINNFNMIS